MYNYELVFILVGMPDEVAALASGLTPLDGFTHKIESFSGLADVPRKKMWPRHTYVIIRGDSNMDMEALRELFGAKAKFVLCVDREENFADNFYSDIYALWPWPLNGAFAGYELRDLQRRIKMDKDAWLREQQLEITFDMLPDLVWIKDIPGHHMRVNAAFCETVGKTKAEIAGKFHTYIWGGSADAAAGEAVCRESEIAVAKAGHTCHFEETIRHPKRGLCEFSILKTPIYDEDGRVIGTVGIARDVTKEVEDQEKILQLARTDSLTGLANRRYFYQYIDDNRNGLSLTICYIDLDHFKQVNDKFGHQSGDAALLGVAELMRNAFPKDFITRLGGDEFVVAVLGIAAREEVLKKVELLMETAKEFFKLDECLEGLSMSIGIASSTADENISLEELLQQSDRALYYSKEHGRDRFTFYDDIRVK